MFSCVSPSSLTSTVFPLPLPWGSLISKERSHAALQFRLALHIMWLLISASVPIYCRRSSEYMLWLLGRCFCGSLNNGRGCISNSFVCSWDSFSHVVLLYPALRWGILSFLIVSFVLFVCCLLEAWSLLKRKWKGSESWREGIWGVALELWGVEGE